MAKTVTIIDDDPSTCRALKRLLEIAGYTTSSYNSAKEYLDDMGDSQPDCFLLDVHMPGLDGLSLQQKLNEQRNKSPVVFMTGRGDVPMSVRAMRAGASDFLLKPVDEADLLDALQQAMTTSQQSLSPDDQERLKRLKTLTAREREVLGEILTGALNKQIANTLQIAERTVKMHRSRVTRKLEAKSVLDLAAFKDL
jgi:FixJ family two-component response regulator